jgi:hypothetical protein
MNIQQRIQSPTPRFFKKVRKIGLILASLSATIIAAPVVLPAAVVNIAGYLAVAGTVATAISQATVKKEEEDPADGGGI